MTQVHNPRIAGRIVFNRWPAGVPPELLPAPLR
jgi:hypothetical protein